MLSENKIGFPNLTLEEEVNGLLDLRRLLLTVLSPEEPKPLQQVLNSKVIERAFTPLLEDKIFTVPEVAAYLKISKSKIYYLVARRQIPHVRLGRNVRIRKSDLLKWLELRIEKAPPT